jgi:hypothetical protein
MKNPTMMTMTTTTTTYPGMKRLLKVLNSQRYVSFFSVAILHRQYGTQNLSNLH